MRGSAPLRALAGSTSPIRRRAPLPAGAALSPRQGPRGGWRESEGLADRVDGVHLSSGGGAIAKNMGLLLQHHGRWLRCGASGRVASAWKQQRGDWRPGVRTLSRCSDAIVRAGGMLEDETVENEHGGPDDVVKLSGQDWYVLGGQRSNGTNSHGDHQMVLNKKMAAMAMIELLDALTSQKGREEAQGIVNSDKLHSRMANTSQGSARTRGGAAHEPTTGRKGANGVNGHAHGARHVANGAGESGKNDEHKVASTAANGSSTTYSSRSEHASANGCAEMNGHHAEGEELRELRELGRLFEEALIVHRGKPGLESHRPNPYVGDELPPDLATHLTSTDSILSRPIAEDKVPAFFSDLLRRWHSIGLLRVAGPQTREEAESCAGDDPSAGTSEVQSWMALTGRKRGHMPNWAKYSDSQVKHNPPHTLTPNPKTQTSNTLLNHSDSQVASIDES